MPEDLFRLLDLSPSASLEEIHAAYRRKASEHHPDLGGDTQKFKQLSDAYRDLIRQCENRRMESVKRSSGTESKRSTSPTAPNPNANSPTPPKPDSLNPYHAAPPTTDRRTAGNAKKKSQPFRWAEFKRLLTGKLPLQDQTTYFILVNSLDIFLTFLILRSGGFEANPIAAWFIRHWGKYGMIWFKLSIVAAVCIIAQVVALRSIRKASFLLNIGTLIITGVVLYSVWLLAN